MAKKVYFIYAFLFICIAAFAQKSPGLLTGIVLDATNSTPADGASVQLYSSKDSAFSRRQLTDTKGNFTIENLPFGIYRLHISYTGYGQLVLDSINIRAERYDFDLGDLKLQKSETELNSVIVYAEKPLIENKDGKVVYNVSESALSAGSNTSELLKNMPLISNDPNGRLLLKGKEPKILIDDKPVDLTAQQLTELLESLPGGSIERIELMTTPPPQYATEQGGVINIVTRKGRIGWIGRATVSAGSRGEGTATVNLTYRNKKLMVGIIAGAGASVLNGNSYSRRQNIYTDSTNYFRTDAFYKNKNLRPNLRLQLDYEASKKVQWSFVAQANSSYANNMSTTEYTNLDRFEKIYRLSNRTNRTHSDNISLNLQPSFTYRGSRPGEILRIIGSYAYGNTDNSRRFFQQFLNPDASPTGVDSTQDQLTDNTSHNTSVRINYDVPLAIKNLSFSTGTTWNNNINQNVLNTFFLRKTDNFFARNNRLSSNFHFTQNIYTVRAGLSFRVPKRWQMTANLQAEKTNFYFSYKDSNTRQGNDYWNIMPSFTIRRDLTERTNISGVYRKSVRRPGIWELNPAIDYGDPYNLRFGNPTLEPSLAHNFDLNFSTSKGKWYLNSSIGYNIVDNIFNTIRTLQPDGKTFLTWQNIAGRKEYEASLFGGYTFSSAFRVNASAGFSQSRYDTALKRLYKYRDGNTFYTALNYNIIFSKVFTMDGNFRFNSYADPQGRSKSNIGMNLGVQHRFFNRRLTVGITLTDPLTRQTLTTYTYGNNFALESYNSARTRNYRVTIAWQLNNTTPKKPAGKKISTNELKKIMKK